MSRRNVIGVILGCAAILILLLFINWVFIAQQRFSYYDSGSYSKYGFKALFLLLRREKYQVTAVATEPPDRSQLLILLSTGKIAAPQKKRLLNWVRSGGVILELTPNQPGIDSNPGTIEEAVGHRWTTLPENSYFSATFPPAAGIRYRPKSNLIFTNNQPDQGYFHYQAEYFCYRTDYGKGSIISWNDLDGLTNLQIKDHPDNAVAFALLLAYLTGERRRVMIFNLTRSELHFNLSASLTDLFDRYGSCIVLMFVGISLVFWKIMRRFGRPRPLNLIRGRTYQEFLISMAGLFQQAGAQQVVIDNLRNSLRRIMADITNSPPDSDPEAIITKLSAVVGKDYGALQTVYRQSENWRLQPAVTFLNTARQLDNYRRELLQWKTFRAW